MIGNGQPMLPPPMLTLTGFNVEVAPGPDDGKILVIVAQNGSMGYQIPLPAEAAKAIGSRLLLHGPTMTIPRG